MTTAPVKLHRGEFANEPLVDFSKPENRRAMEEALAKVKAELGREYPLLIDGEKFETSDKLRSINPSRTDQVVGTFSKATAELATRAIEENRARVVPAWLTRVDEALKGTVTRLPTRDEMEPSINEQLIVEYYSRF